MRTWSSRLRLLVAEKNCLKTRRSRTRKMVMLPRATEAAMYWGPLSRMGKLQAFDVMFLVTY